MNPPKCPRREKRQNFEFHIFQPGPPTPPGSLNDQNSIFPHFCPQKFSFFTLISPISRGILPLVPYFSGVPEGSKNKILPFWGHLGYKAIGIGTILGISCLMFEILRVLCLNAARVPDVSNKDERTLKIHPELHFYLIKH